MTIEVDVLSEVYTILKQYIPAKDRQEAADNLLSVMVDMLGDQDLKEFGATDAALKRAFKQYAEDAEEIDEHDEDDSDW
jgi:uncharacterized protein YqeY